MDVSKFRTGDWLLVAGGAVMLIFGFALDWVTADTIIGQVSGGNAFDFFFTGGIAYLLVVGAGVVAFLLAGDLINADHVPWPIVLLGATGLATLLMLLRLLLGSGYDGRGPRVGHVRRPHRLRRRPRRRGAQLHGLGRHAQGPHRLRQVDGRRCGRRSAVAARRLPRRRRPGPRRRPRHRRRPDAVLSFRIGPIGPILKDRSGSQSDVTISAISSPASVGLSPTLTPAAARASILPCAVPLPPETIAPAWPIFLPAGAVTPAM